MFPSFHVGCGSVACEGKDFLHSTFSTATVIASAICHLLKLLLSTRQVGILRRPFFENATTALQEAVLAVAAGRIPLPSRDVPTAAASTWWMAAMRFMRTSNV